MVNSTDNIDDVSPIAKPPRWPCREVDPIRRVIGFNQSWEGIVIAIVKWGSSEDEETWHQLPTIMPSMNRTRYQKQYKQEATYCRVAVVGLLHCGGRETRRWWRGKQKGRSVWIYRRKMKRDWELTWDPLPIGRLWIERTPLELGSLFLLGQKWGGLKGQLRWIDLHYSTSARWVRYFGIFNDQLQEFWFLVTWVTWKCQPVKRCIIL